MASALVHQADAMASLDTPLVSVLATAAGLLESGTGIRMASVSISLKTRMRTH